ncbi:Pycsar system effector family protein [Spongiimicrobium salis]|uniref:Pycsar system effector family protein n=1 Tax=Spongiimicrobium salis TaxID=1667022 RepID=UPI00374CB1DC
MSKKEKERYLMEELAVDKEGLKRLKKKLSKIEPRAERGVETLFRLLSKNQYTLNTMIDRKSNILISINALILSIVLGTVLNQLDTDPHLIYPVILILGTNLISIAYAVLSTRPELTHGETRANNLLFYGNFHEMKEQDYVDQLMGLMNEGDELYTVIAKDAYHLGKTMNRKFKLLRRSFTIFLVGIILSVLAFIMCHLLFSGFFS